MTPKQTQLYWREWAAVRRARPDADRDALTVAALGRRVSSKAFTNAEFDKILAAFRAVSRPGDLREQLRAQAQPRQRKEHRIHEVLECLAVYLGREAVAGYVTRVLGERWPVPAGGSLGLDDLSDHPYVRIQHGVAVESPSDLTQALMTIWSRLQPMRRKARHTLHDMRMAAGVRCDCKECRESRWLAPETAADEPAHTEGAAEEDEQAEGALVGAARRGDLGGEGDPF